MVQLTQYQPPPLPHFPLKQHLCNRLCDKQVSIPHLSTFAHFHTFICLFNKRNLLLKETGHDTRFVVLPTLITRQFGNWRKPAYLDHLIAKSYEVSFSLRGSRTYYSRLCTWLAKKSLGLVSWNPPLSFLFTETKFFMQNVCKSVHNFPYFQKFYF